MNKKIPRHFILLMKKYCIYFTSYAFNSMLFDAVYLYAAQ